MRIMNLAELLDSSVSILRKYSKSFILFNLGYWALASIALMVILTLLTLGIIGAMVAGGGETDAFMGLAVIIMILALAMGACNSVGAIHLASQDVLPVSVDAARAISSSIKSTFPVTGLILLGALPIVPLGYGVWKLAEGTVMGLWGKTSGEWLTALGTADQRFLLTVTALLLGFLVLAAFFSAYVTWFIFSLQALVLERKTPLGAIRRSIQLVRGRFWHLYGAVSLMTLITSGISFSLDSFFLMIAGLVELGLHLSGLEPGMGFTSVYVYGRGIANFFYVLLFNSLGAVIVTRLYYNRLFETEGYDLILRLAALPMADARQEES